MLSWIRMKWWRESNKCKCGSRVLDAMMRVKKMWIRRGDFAMWFSGPGQGRKSVWIQLVLYSAHFLCYLLIFFFCECGWISSFVNESFWLNFILVSKYIFLIFLLDVHCGCLLLVLENMIQCLLVNVRLFRYMRVK